MKLISKLCGDEKQTTVALCDRLYQVVCRKIVTFINENSFKHKIFCLIRGNVYGFYKPTLLRGNVKLCTLYV